MSRLAELQYDEMTPDQRRVHDDIMAGPRGRVGGPMNAWFRNPELAQLSQSLGAFCRYRTSLDPRLSEMVILTVARHWTAQVEWRIHKPIALAAGLDPAIADAIEARERPDFGGDGEAAAVYDVASEIQQTRRLGDAAYASALDALGETRLVELIALLGYYTSVAMILNAFDVPVPEGGEVAAPLAD